MKFTKKNTLKIVLITLVSLFILSFFSAELTIRRYVFMHLQPINSLKLEIKNMNYFDEEYGYLYDVKGYEDFQTMDELGVFYLKKHWIFWDVSSVGTGP
ncbi:hypothetical protein [Paenibacillus sp. J5C2022]|uniref:hypothetical protein n=1 Tax=Paenibacillus sp. J5C2022 TaxID=2977129 RepID=UPI0021CEA450|nr:hypothetical protein [Paenibacillus sp. J5C2022]